MDRCCCRGPGTVVCRLVRGPAGLLMPPRGTRAGEAPRPRVSPQGASQRLLRLPSRRGPWRSQDLPGRAHGSVWSGAGGGPPAPRPKTPETAAMLSAENTGRERPRGAGTFPWGPMGQRLLLLRLLTRCCLQLSRQHAHRTLKSWGLWESASGPGRPEGSLSMGSSSRVTSRTW